MTFWSKVNEVFLSSWVRECFFFAEKDKFYFLVFSCMECLKNCLIESCNHFLARLTLDQQFDFREKVACHLHTVVLFSRIR